MVKIKEKKDKVRSLLELQRALREEVYELCPVLIDAALHSGATRREISWIIRHPSWHVETAASMN